MASDIQTYLNDILNTVYGRDVRNAIHDAIELCYDDASSGKTIAEAAADSVGTAITDATNATNAATAAASAANTAANAANSATDSANTAADNATTATANANQAASNATEAANEANSASVVASNAAESANDAAQAANEAVEAIGQLDIDVEQAKSAIQDAIDAASAANTAADNADTAAANANQAATNANNKASAADTAANACTTAVTSANLAATNANNAKDAANTAASNARDARDAANTAANNANSAANSANNAASAANTATNTANAKITAMDSKMFDAESATNNANTAATNANTAAGNANSAAATIEGLTVDYEDGGPNAPASATLETKDGHRNIHFVLRQGASGASFTIKGSAYATLADLQEGVPNPEVGDQYNVGSAPPYHIYRWTGSNWEDQGTIGQASDPITAQDVQEIQNGREIEGASTKVMKVEALSYLIHTLLANALANKVDKVTGKGLSSVDFTAEDKASLTSLSSTVATLSDSKVDKVTGKSLSTNDLTDALLNKIMLIGDDTLTTSAVTIIAAINELVSGKASLASPEFTGTPTTTTPSSGDNSNKIASTAFVQNTVSSATGSKANLDSPAFTGTPTAPTPSTADNTDKIATTAYVQSNLAAKGNIYSTNVQASSWEQESTATYSGYSYRCTIPITGVTSTMFAMVTYHPDQVTSGNYAPVCETYDGGVYIYSKVNTTITIPTIAVFR